MFIVRGASEMGPVSIACGTSGQALEKVLQLLGRGFQNVTVTDPTGRSRSADEFLRIAADEEP
ncbi:hypothetical protein JNW90_17570 [Micromonospora sp. STR1s_5]|nr:hypothetical protein [Micromonospora sp. STR1s_5]